MKKNVPLMILVTLLIASCNGQKTSDSGNDSLKTFPEQIISKTSILFPFEKNKMKEGVIIFDKNNINDTSALTVEVEPEFVKNIIDQVLQGKINIYKEYGDTAPLSIDRFKASLVIWDSTVVFEDPNNPGTMISAPVKYDLSNEINEIRFIEDWKYDSSNGNIIKKVIAYSLIANINHPPAEKTIFYFWLKKL